MNKEILQIIFVFILVFTFIWLIKFLLRKVLHIKKEKKEFFSHNHINDNHKKIDWTFRISFMVINFLILFLFLYKDFELYTKLLAYTLIVSTVLDLGLRAYFEWKYSEQPKQSIVTISEMILLTTAIVMFFTAIL